MEVVWEGFMEQVASELITEGGTILAGEELEGGHSRSHSFIPLLPNVYDALE